MTGDERDGWMKFIDALEAVQPMAHDHGHRRLFLEKFKSELVLLSFWMNELRIVGGEPTRSVSAPERCDSCGGLLVANGLHVDGQVKDGRWSHMCLTCFGKDGAGLGWGVGQLYRMFGKDTNGMPIWRCIAGGNPEPDSED